MSLTRATPVLCLFALLIGCAEEGRGPKGRDRGPDPTTTSPGRTTTTPIEPWLELGTGDLAHEPLLDPSDPVILVFGAQQGFHVEVSGAVHGLGEIVDVLAWVEREDGTRVAESQGTALRLAAWDGEVGFFAGEQAVLFDWSLAGGICPLEGQRVTIRAAVEDLADGRAVEGSAVGTAQVDAEIRDACP